MDSSATRVGGNWAFPAGDNSATRAADSYSGKVAGTRRALAVDSSVSTVEDNSRPRAAGN